MSRGACFLGGARVQSGIGSVTLAVGTLQTGDVLGGGGPSRVTGLSCARPRSTTRAQTRARETFPLGFQFSPPLSCEDPAAIGASAISAPLSPAASVSVPVAKLFRLAGSLPS
eukprot:7386268-Prymnesium_polylepis.1